MSRIIALWVARSLAPSGVRLSTLRFLDSWSKGYLRGRVKRLSMVTTMRRFLVLLLAVSAFAADPPSCLIIKHASTSRQIFVSGANWQYVAGDFPKGMEWKSNVTDRYVRKIKAAGGIVVILPADYTAADLADARKQCVPSSPKEAAK